MIGGSPVPLSSSRIDSSVWVSGKIWAAHYIHAGQKVSGTVTPQISTITV